MTKMSRRSDWALAHVWVFVTPLKMGDRLISSGYIVECRGVRSIMTSVELRGTYTVAGGE